jgi:hypothetical protein
MGISVKHVICKNILSVLQWSVFGTLIRLERERETALIELQLC